MAEDPVVKDVPANFCCTVWKEKYSKLQQRCTKLEDGRTALRQGIEIFERQIAKMQSENMNLKKAYEEERVRTVNEREDKIKESAMRVSLENKISALKSEILSLQQKGGSGAQDVDEEVTVLRARVSEGVTEINGLKELLDKERTRADSEKKKAAAEKEKAEAEKKKVNEARKMVEAEKSKVDRVRADNEREEKVKESAMRVCLENEISALKSEILSLQQKGDPGAQAVDDEVTRVSEGGTEINCLKELLEEERKRADSHTKKAEAEKKKANEARKMVKAEKSKADRVRADNEREEKAKESVMRVSLENEISALKSEILSLQQKGGPGAQSVDEEVTLLRARVSEGETEINRLKELLEEERMRADSEKMKAEAEKKNASEAWKLVQAEKSRADEGRRLAAIDGEKAEEGRLQLDRLKVEADEEKLKLVLETLKSEEANKKLEAERQNVIREKRRADSEMANAEKQRELAEMRRKKFMEEKYRADHLSQQMEEDKHKIEELQKKIDELVSIKLVGAPADLPVKKLNDETAKLTGSIQLETMKREAVESKLVLECLKSEEANKRLEDIKQKANRETKRADSELRKAKEQRKVAEEYREKAMEEKIRADQLAQQLEDNSRRTEELQKEIQELVSSRTLVEPSVVPPDKNINVETARMKLLRKQLKFEKMQVKHAKQVTKLEKDRTKLLQQELCCLKQEFVQFSHRVDILHDCFSHSDVGIDDLAKTGNISNTQSLNLKRKHGCIEPNHMHLPRGNELLKTSCTVIDASDRFKQSIDCSAPLLPVSGGNCSKSISGIDSKLEPLLRGSDKKMLQSSAMISSTASFSDRPLVGSQERGAFAVIESPKLAEEKTNTQPTIRLSGEVTNTRYNESIAVVAENSVRSPLRNDAVGRSTRHLKKRKRILDAIESIEHLYSEGKKWHLQIAENLSLLHTTLESQMEGRRLVPNLPDNMYTKRDKSHKKQKVFSEEKIATELLKSNDPKDGYGTKDIGQAKVYLHASPHINNVTGTAQACKDGIGNSRWHDSRSFDEVADGDYMKLLNLDSTVDEEIYCVAVEMPLSPTLPEIEFQSCETFEMDNSKRIDSFYEEFSNENDNMVPYGSFDVLNEEIDSNKLKLNTSLREKEGVSDSSEIFVNEEIGKFNIVHARNACISQSLDSGVELGMAESRYEGRKISCENNLRSTRDDLPPYCVVFSEITDGGSISKIFCATRSCMSQCSMIPQTDWVVQKALFALLKVEDLLPKEKVCVFFSLLLHSFSGIDLVNVRNILDRDLIFFLDSFAGHMHTVMSDVETVSMFAEVCNLDELLTLIEDFLLYRRVTVCGDVSSEPLRVFDPRVNIVLNGGDTNLSFQKASSHQLVCGAIVLASLCAAVDHIGFICEASYNIFRMQKIDSSMLTILHIFAHICGSEYFTLNDYSLALTVIKSLVTFLERANLSTDSTSPLPSLTEVRPEFPSCTECPFSEGVVCMDVVVSLLLEKLQNYGLSDIPYEDLLKSVNLLNSDAMSHKQETVRSSGHGEDFCDLCRNRNVSCHLHKFGKPISQSETVFDGNLCHLGDVLSLVELVASNMSWDWTCDNIVRQLVKMLEESSVLENPLAAIVILLGQLGRLGVDAKGYEDTGVEYLLGRLSAFLYQSAARKMGLPIQIAAVTALLGVTSLNFEELIKSNVELPAVASHSVPANFIKKWFSLLSNEQQFLSYRLLSADVV